MRRLYALIAVFFIAVPLYAEPARLVPGVTHVAIISVDGMRPDLLLRADMPNVRKLMAGGSYTFWARTTEMSITLPSHTSMLTGVPPQQHGFTFNDDGPVEPVHPKVVSIFDIAHQAGQTSGFASGKSKLALIPLPESVDWMAAPARGKGGDDDSATRDAVRIILEHKPNLMFLHLPNNDGVGHANGWGSPEQIRALEHADACIGLFVGALRQAGVLGQTVIILTADHGGHAKGHGPNDPRSRHIPWIIYGPGIKKDLDLDLVREEQVNTEDTFATACALLGLTVDHPVTGRVVQEALLPASAPISVPAEPVVVPASGAAPVLATQPTR